MDKKRVVILGAGFAGLQLARDLQATDYDITIIDQYNFHQFQPLFYQVATGRIEPSSISFPLRKVFQKKTNVHVRVAKVKNVDTVNQIVVTERVNVPYDYLVIATGCSTNFFGNKNIEKYAFSMKSSAEAIALRNRLLLNFEDALDSPEQGMDSIMNIVIAGGGPTGVELAGALIEMKRNILPKDYPDMDFSRLKVYLVEGSPYTLLAMSDSAKKKSREYLEEMGVEVWVNAMAKDYDGKVVTFQDGRTIVTRNFIWAAGVAGNVPEGISKDAVVRGNRIAVDETHHVKGLNNVFAIGDISYMETPEWPKGHAQLANVAKNQAKNLADNLKKAAKGGGGERKFTYTNPGTMATVGKGRAVVDLPFMSFHGWFAWLTWMFLHLFLILSVKNRVIIFINWAISYFTNDTTLRLILLPTKKQVELAQYYNSVKLDDSVKEEAAKL